MASGFGLSVWRDYTRLYPLSPAMRHQVVLFKTVLMQVFGGYFRVVSFCEGGGLISGQSQDEPHHQNWLECLETSLGVFSTRGFPVCPNGLPPSDKLSFLGVTSCPSQITTKNVVFSRL